MKNMLTSLKVTLLILVLVTAVTAATITVTNVHDSGPGSLRQAIADATPGSTIDFDPAVFSSPRTITLTSSQLVIDKNLTIQGPGRDLLTISGNHLMRAFAINGGVTAKLEGLTIKDGNALASFADGGGIYNNGTLTLNGVAVTGSIGRSGGGIFNIGILTITNSIILGNSADTQGGGVSSFGGLSVSKGTISNNQADVGGGVYQVSSEGGLTISDTTVSGNKALTYGGGIFVDGNEGCWPGVRLALNGSTVSGNTGAGLVILRTSASFYNSTVSSNHGDGIRIDNGTVCNDTFKATNTTVFGNGGTGVGDDYDQDLVGLTNTVVANNQGANITGVVETASHNLIGDAASAGGIQNGVNGNIVGVNPLLGPLRDNGGLTMTHALRLGSPAINAGDNCVLAENGCGFTHPALTTDQRGMPRNGTVDIGAFERQAVDVSSVAPFDYDGDSKSDFSVWRPGDETWYLALSKSGTMGVQQWGSTGDKIVPADYDGDGVTDMAVYRPNDNGSGLGHWYVINSSNFSFNDFQFGVNGDIPLPQDYDGDSRADLCVFRPADSTWYMVKSTNNLFYVYPFGVTGDKPVPADYTGDGKAEIAVWRPADGSWHTVDLTDGGYRTFNWGVTGDVPVPGDYSGDGRADYAVYRPANNTWYRMNSSDFFMYDTRWGVANDIPTPGDYDGDGRIDLAVFRPSEGRWYVLTQTYAFMTQQFGINGDIPTESAFVY
jgi:hypothetical protein